jgi:hypothetical protein
MRRRTINTSAEGAGRETAAERGTQQSHKVEQKWQTAFLGKAIEESTRVK